MIRSSSVAYIILSLYAVFGLALSAVPVISKLGFVFAFTGSIYMLSVYLRRRTPIPNFFIVVSAFFCFLLISSIWSPISNYSAIGGILTVYFSCFFVVSGLYLKIITPLGVVVIMTLPGLINVIAYFLGINYVTEIYDLSSDSAIKRFGGFIGHPNAMLTRMMLPLLIAAVIGDKLIESNFFNKVVFPIIILLGVFAVFSSGSKKALLFFVIALPLILAFYPMVRYRMALFFCISVIPMFILFWYFSTVDLSTSGVEVFVRISNMFEGDESTKERYFMALMGLNLFSESPIFGHGLNSFSVMSGLGYYSHNNAVEILVSGGLLLFLCYYFVFFYSVLFSGIKVSWFYALGVLLLFIGFDSTSVSFMDRGIHLVYCLFAMNFLVRKVA